MLDNISADRADLQGWVVDVRETSVRLQEQRARCDALPNNSKYLKFPVDRRNLFQTVAFPNRSTNCYSGSCNSGL